MPRFPRTASEDAISIAAQLVRVMRGGLSRRREVRVRLTQDIEATIYDRPGLWMNDADLARLRGELRGIAQAGVGGDLDYGVFKQSRAPYENRLICIGRHLGNQEAVGFNAMPRFDLKIDGRALTVLHLGLLVIHPRYQRQGLQGLLYGLGAFSAYHRLPERPVWLSNVTEVPAVFGAVSDQFLDVYPHYKRSAPPPAQHQAIARAIMRHHRHEFGVGPDAQFDDERFVIMGSYTGGSDALKKTFESAPKHRVPEANLFCQEQLDYSRGDDFLQIAKLDATVLSAWLARRVPAELRPAAAREMKIWTYPTSPKSEGEKTS